MHRRANHELTTPRAARCGTPLAARPRDVLQFIRNSELTHGHMEEGELDTEADSRVAAARVAARAESLARAEAPPARAPAADDRSSAPRSRSRSMSNSMEPAASRSASAAGDEATPAAAEARERVSSKWAKYNVAAADALRGDGDDDGDTAMAGGAIGSRSGTSGGAASSTATAGGSGGATGADAPPAEERPMSFAEMYPYGQYMRCANGAMIALAPQPTPSQGPTTLFVGGLDAAGTITEYELALAFSQAGPVSHIKILRGDRPCAFVQFQTAAAAERALVSMQGLQMGLCRLRVQWGRSNKPPPPLVMMQHAAPVAPPGAFGAAPGAGPVGALPFATTAAGGGAVDSTAPVGAAAASSASSVYRYREDYGTAPALAPSSSADAASVGRLVAASNAYADTGDGTTPYDVDAHNAVWARAFASATASFAAPLPVDAFYYPLSVDDAAEAPPPGSDDGQEGGDAIVAGSRAAHTNAAAIAATCAAATASALRGEHAVLGPHPLAHTVMAPRPAAATR